MKWNDDAFTIRRYIGIGGLLASALGLALIMRFTVAYLGDTTTPRENTLNVGYADVSIVEEFSKPSELGMSNIITKQVRVQNNSTVRAFVRVYAEFSDSEIAKQAKVRYKGATYSWQEFKTRLNYLNPNFTGDGSALADSSWRYVPETVEGLSGYFYYTRSLKEKDDDSTLDMTEQLFDHVIIDYKKYGENSVVQDSSNIDRIVPLEMIVYSELIQTVDTGETTVKAVDEHGNAIQDEANNQVTSSVYGYDFDKNTLYDEYEWEDAWRRFLKLETDREQNSVQPPETPEEPETP